MKNKRMEEVAIPSFSPK